MAIEACMKCSDIQTSIAFYTGILDFIVDVPPHPDKTEFMSKYSLLKREGSLLHLSSHDGDGVFGNLVYIRVQNIETVYESVLSRGINVDEPEKYPSLTIQLTEQTWSMKEFSVRDPDGNKITYGQEC